ARTKQATLTITPLLLYLLQLSLSSPVRAVDSQLPELTICYNYNCSRAALVRPAAGEWQTVVNQFQPAARSAVEEREMIRRAIAVLEQIVGMQTPTFRDRGRNPVVDDWPGQMDCIDESTNTKRYLDLLQAQGLLRWHRVAERAYRAPYLFDPHWAGQIIELESGASYVVDSWYLDNGNPPYIQALNKWLRKDPIQE
ncbi:MAG: hypothetical protein LJE75_05765, partial [Gammaproteobacteria bacterium]|nr:hypothetical protein [Gammaproteobacteria bacterium]